MLESLFKILLAREQATLFIGGLILVLLGGVFVADHIYMRLRGKRFKGRLIGVREKAPDSGRGNTIYYPVVEYMDDYGENVQAETDVGSSGLANKIPGKRVNLLIQPGKPHEARIMGITRLVFGAIFVSIGLLLAGIALTQYNINVWSYIIGVVILIALGLWGLYKLSGKQSQSTDVGVTDTGYEKRLKENRALPLLGPDETLQRLKDINIRARKWSLIMGLVSLAVIGTGQYLAQDLYSFLLSGKQTEGTIIGFKRTFYTADNRNVFYPEVEYVTPDGQTVHFQGKVGTNISVHKSGEKVSVIYQPQNPHKAMINFGIWNWITPLAIIFIGFVFFIMALTTGIRPIINRT